MKPAVKIVARSQAPRRKRVRVPVDRHAPPMDARTKVFIAGAALGCLAIAFLTYRGLGDTRVFSTGLLLAVSGPVCLTIANLKSYLPRAYSVRKRELWNVPLGIPLGVAVYYVWKIFPAMYSALEEVVWRPAEFGGGVYLEAMQIALDTAAGYLLGFVLVAILVGLQAAIWVVPAYLLAKRVTGSVEEQVEKFYRRKIRQSTRRIVGRLSHITKFRVGGELAETKVQLRLYGTMLSLFSGLTTITILAWVLPLL